MFVGASAYRHNGSDSMEKNGASLVWNQPTWHLSGGARHWQGNICIMYMHGCLLIHTSLSFNIVNLV